MGCSLGSTRNSLRNAWSHSNSISFQLVIIPCSMGYFSVSTPLFERASSPKKTCLFSIPGITAVYLGLPTTDGKTYRGYVLPPKPILHSPDPLSITTLHILSPIVGFWLLQFTYQFIIIKLRGVPQCFGKNTL